MRIVGYFCTRNDYSFIVCPDCYEDKEEDDGAIYDTMEDALISTCEVCNEKLVDEGEVNYVAGYKLDEYVVCANCADAYEIADGEDIYVEDAAYEYCDMCSMALVEEEPTIED